LILDRLLSPSSKFSNLGGGDAKLWRQAEGMDGGGNTSPKLLIAADVCHKFMACDSFAQESGSNSGGSRSEVDDAAAGAASGGQSDLILDEAVKLLEKWDSQNDNSEALEGLTKNIVKLAETSHDRLVCDDFQRVQKEYGLLREKSESTGNDKLCFACAKMATMSIEHMLTTDHDHLVSVSGVLGVLGCLVSSSFLCYPPPSFEGCLTHFSNIFLSFTTTGPKIWRSLDS
jgi:hypothetical protein